MPEKKTGEAAFARAVSYVYPELEPAQEGMTLWDYFFNRQVAALITGLMARNHEPGYDGDDIMIYEAVRLGKIAADVMLKEREK